MFLFCIPRRRLKLRILSSLLILAVLLTFLLVRQEVNKKEREEQSVIPRNPNAYLRNSGSAVTHTAHAQSYYYQICLVIFFHWIFCYGVLSACCCCCSCTLQEFNKAIKTEVRKSEDVTNDGKKSVKLEKRKPQAYLFLLSIIHRVLQLHHSRRLGGSQKHAYYKHTWEKALRH